MDWSTDANATYAEISTFDDTLSEWVATNVTSVPGVPSYYAIDQRTVKAFTFTQNNSSITKTYATPKDFSKFSELALWLFSPQYTGLFLQIGLGANAPNEYTHVVLVPASNKWCQDTFDVSGIPSSVLQAIKYVTITCVTAAVQGVPVVVAFDELVIRRTTMLESVYRALAYLLDGKVSTLINDVPVFATATQRTPEFFKREHPGYLIHLDPATFDNTTIGRVGAQATRRERLPNNNSPMWKIQPRKTAYLLRVQIDIYSKYEGFDLVMEEHLISVINPRGALQVAGDLIDFLQISSASLDEGNIEQRAKRKMFEYELWTWDSPVSKLVSSATSLAVEFDYIVPDNSTPGPDMRPDTFVFETKTLGE